MIKEKTILLASLISVFCFPVFLGISVLICPWLVATSLATVSSFALYSLIIWLKKKQFPIKIMSKFFVFLGLLCLFLFISYVAFIKEKTWGDIGTMAAGCFTGMSGFFTLATLLFIVFQHATNEPLSNLEKTFKHKELLVKNLDLIEENLDYRFKISNRLELYHLLFPQNIGHRVSFTQESPPPILQKLDQLYSEIIMHLEIFHEMQSSKDLEDGFQQTIQIPPIFLISFNNLKNNLALVPKEKDGDIAINGYPIGLNLFEFEKDVNSVGYIINQLYQFIGHNYSYRTIASHHKFKNAIYNYINSSQSQYGMTVKYPSDIEFFFDVLNKASSLSPERAPKNHEEATIYNNLTYLIWTIQELLSNSNKLKIILDIKAYSDQLSHWASIIKQVNHLLDKDQKELGEDLFNQLNNKSLMLNLMHFS